MRKPIASIVSFSLDRLRLLRQPFNRHKTALGALFGVWGLYLFIVFVRALDNRPDGLYASHVNIWSDWSLHIAIANIFAHKPPSEWFAYHPIYADGKFTYGFLSNLISGLLMRAGFSLYWAFILPSLVYVVLLLLGCYSLLYRLLNSKKQTLVAISFFFLGSGPGFIKFLRDVANGYPWKRLLFPDPDFDYSRIVQYQWYTGNFIVGMLLPQRAFLLGMTLAVWVLVGLLSVLQNRLGDRSLNKQVTKQEATVLLLCALATGLLVITHVHSLIVLAIIVGAIALVSFRQWVKLGLFYGLPAITLSLTLYFIFLEGGIENPDFIQWRPGWTAEGGLLKWLVMWLKIWGLMVPIAALGLLALRGKPRSTQAFFVGTWGLFFFANLIQMQPMPWDNSKLFLWVYFGFSGLAALALAWVWRRGGRWFGKGDAILAALLLSLTGAVELVRLQFINQGNPPMISQAEMQLAVQVRDRTDSQARFLTAPVHNSWVMVWSARPILLGDRGWAWNYGFVTNKVEQDIKTMFLGGDQAAWLLAKYRLSYVVIGPTELHDWHANAADFERRYPLAFSNQHYRVYDTRSLWQGKTVLPL